MNIIKTLKSSISEKGNYCYSLPVETTKEIIKDVKQLQQEKDKLKEQQKEFIRYLKEKEKQFDMVGDPINSGACCGILNKYKEIIGDDK